ncbi:thioredoxin-like protein [Pilatotrama ljubarskyi]|nr:thioredoxin-like protein [Pilatotrama ljubarskyi]
MVQNGQITFYTHTYSPYCHRVHIALVETQAKYSEYVVNTMDKPAWFAAKVNPAGKIPAITYGGSAAPAEDPAPDAAKIPESTVFLEFLAELFPEAKLLPTDPVLRAKARLLVIASETHLLEGFKVFFFAHSPEAEKTLLDSLEALPESGFAVGEWSIADIAAGPFLARIEMLLRHDLGSFPAGEGVRVHKVLQSERFARLGKYLDDVKAWPSFRDTWNEELQAGIWRQNPAFKRR